MIRAKNYETVFESVKVMPRKLVASFFRTRYIIQLSAATQSVSPRDILVVFVDFNAVSGSCYNDHGIIRTFGSGTQNDNSERLLTCYGMYDLSSNHSWFMV